jgi:hypothetical protein
VRVGAVNGQHPTPAGLLDERVGSETALGEIDRDRITPY